MPVLAVLPILVAGGLAWLVRGEGDRDAPARVVAAAAARLPAYRQDWGRAMVAELTQIHGRSSRYRCRAGLPGTCWLSQPVSSSPRSASRIKIGYIDPARMPSWMHRSYP